MYTFVVYYPKLAPEIRSFKDKKFLLGELLLPKGESFLSLLDQKYHFLIQ
jgi:hypothetical protein